jgi:hypothetical protein
VDGADRHDQPRACVRRADADGGTDVLAVHDGLPRGVPAADNKAGWRSSLSKLAALVEGYDSSSAESSLQV